MRRAAGPIRAIGRLWPDGPWVGFQAASGGYRLVFGADDGLRQPDPTSDPLDRRAGLVAAAIAFFLDCLAGAPAELEATQADIARLVASLATDVTNSEQRAMAGEALDAVDDGLPADAVVLRLLALLPTSDIDAAEILRARYARIAAQGER